MQSLQVIKLGGASLEENLPQIASVLAATDSPRVIVHGGGPQVSAMASRLGIPTQKVAGRRVTDEATLDVVLMVLAGLVHNRVVGTLVASGVPAVGIAGPSVFRARRRPPIEIDGETVDFGLVGEIEHVEVGPIRAVLERGDIPILPSIAGGKDGALFNVNADTVAAWVAAELGAHELIQVTDSGGVREVNDSVIQDLDLAGTRRLISEGIATDGMRPKLETAIWALRSGVSRVRIVGAGGIGVPDGGTVLTASGVARPVLNQSGLT